MSDDLVKRLWLHDCEGVTREAADRIEELEGQLQSVLDRETSILLYYDAKLDAADAKLAKAVEALELADAALSGANMNMSIVERKVKATIAELKGQQP